MTLFELTQITILFSSLIFASFTIGFNLLYCLTTLLRTDLIKYNLFTTLGFTLLVGIGSLSFFGLIIGLLHIFQKEVIFAFLIINPIIFFLLRNKFLGIFQSNLNFYSLKSVITPFVLTTTFISFAIIFTLYLAALKPPLISDELHYHLPQANLLVQNHVITPDTWGHSLYGAIPKLMEILFAIGILIQGYELTHLFHLSILTAFLIYSFGYLADYFSAKTAALSVLFLLSYTEFTNYALLAFVDTATVCFEITALLSFLDWLLKKRQSSLIISSITLGIALGIKYSSLFTTVFIASVFFFFLINKQKRKEIFKQKTLIFQSLLIFVFLAGFWYIKNLVLYSNPTYPLYFGHSGMTDDEYLSMIQAIQEFGERSISSFLAFPLRYFYFEEVITYLSFFLPFIALFISKNRLLILTLLNYYIIFILYWFFLATHQTRFLMPGLVPALILSAISITNITKKTSLILIPGILILLIIGNFTRPLIRQDMFKGLYQQKLHLKDRQYALGKVTKQTLLFWNFGCQYSVIDFLEKNNLKGAVIDNWTVWHDQSASFYAGKNRFLNFYFTESTSSSSLRTKLETENINYIYYKDAIKADFSKDIDPVEKKYYLQRIDVENFLLQNSIQIYKDLDCNLYQINKNKLTI